MLQLISTVLELRNSIDPYLLVGIFWEAVIIPTELSTWMLKSEDSSASDCYAAAKSKPVPMLSDAPSHKHLAYLMAEKKETTE